MATTSPALALRNATTQHLLDDFRQMPTAAVQDELASRRVNLWHHGLAVIAVEPASCGEDGCYEYVEQDETTCLTHTYDPFEVEIWNER